MNPVYKAITDELRKNLDPEIVSILDMPCEGPSGSTWVGWELLRFHEILEWQNLRDRKRKENESL